MPKFRSGTTTNTGSTIKSTGANVTSVNIINRHNAVIYVRFYNSPVATFQDVPVQTFSVAASGAMLNVRKTSVVDPVFSTASGLSVRVVTDALDNGNTAAATLPVIEIEFT